MNARNFLSSRRKEGRRFKKRAGRLLLRQGESRRVVYLTRSNLIKNLIKSDF